MCGTGAERSHSETNNLTQTSQSAMLTVNMNTSQWVWNALCYRCFELLLTWEVIVLSLNDEQQLLHT